MAVLLVSVTAVGLANEAVFPFERSQVLDVGSEEERNNETPPDWTPDFARNAWEWSQGGAEGPPPWAQAKGRGKNN